MLLFSILGIGQTINYSARPLNEQLYPRNIASNAGTVVIAGSISGSGATRIKVKVLRNGLTHSETTPVPATSGSNFTFTILIPAERAQYSFVGALEISGNFVDNAIIADHVVAGDAIIIQGQSNAGASQNWSGQPVSATYTNAASPYIRVLGSATPSLDATAVTNLQWFVGNGNANPEDNGSTGQWGYVLANLMIQQTNIPIAIFNGSHGGKGIEFFKRNASTPGDLTTNYGRLFARVQKGGFLNAIRAIFWFQGESDADDAWHLPPQNNPDENLTTYKNKLTSLYNGWKTDFPTSGQRFYLHQIRFGCNATFSRTQFINEALRQFAGEHSSDTRIYGTGSLAQEPETDGDPLNRFCHYKFTNGYEKLGIDWSAVLLADLYGNALAITSLSPFVISVNKPSTNQVTVAFSNNAPLTITAGSLTNFFFEGVASQPTITSSSYSGNMIILNLNSFPAGATGLSYAENHRGTNTPDIVTTGTNLAIVNFNNMLIMEGTFPVKLLNFGGLWKNSNEINLHWAVTEEIEMNGYEIQYSADGSNFKNIGFTTANNLPLQQQYTFNHRGTLAPVNYYRLKILNRGGGFTYSSIISLNNKASLKSFAVSVNPNPVINDARIYIESNTAGKAEIVVVNPLGQQVASISRNIQPGLNTITVSKITLSGKGLYFVKIKMGVFMQTSKFVIKD